MTSEFRPAAGWNLWTLNSPRSFLEQPNFAIRSKETQTILSWKPGRRSFPPATGPLALKIAGRRNCPPSISTSRRASRPGVVVAAPRRICPPGVPPPPEALARPPAGSWSEPPPEA